MSNPADKITAELMALHDAAIVKFNAALGDTNAESVNAACDARKALQQAIRRAVDWGEPVAKIKPSQKSMRELLSEAALGDSQPVARTGSCVAPPCRCTTSEHRAVCCYWHPAGYDALPQRAEPASVQAALEYAARHLSSDWPERCREIVRRARAALAAHPSTDQNHSG